MLVTSAKSPGSLMNGGDLVKMKPYVSVLDGLASEFRWEHVIHFMCLNHRNPPVAEVQ